MTKRILPRLLLTLVPTIILPTSYCAAQNQPVVSNLNDSGLGSLREAMLGALPGATITFAPGLRGTITLTSGSLTNDRNVTIQGPGATNVTVTVDITTSSRVFEIVNAATVTIADLCISNGVALDLGYARGGGILNNSGCNLTLSNCWILRNSAYGADDLGGPAGSGEGGGIYTAGKLTMVGCTVSQNNAQGGAGANPGDGHGGGICVAPGAPADLTNCTIVQNSAVGGAGPDQGGFCYGGGIAAQSTFLNLTHCTIDGNYCLGSGLTGQPPIDVLGGGLYAFTVVTMLNTIVAENYLGAGPDDNAVGPDMNGGAISLGFNLIGMTNGSCCWTAGDVYLPGGQLAPLLQPLNFYGGPTPTMMPQSGSAAIDNGTSGGLSTDQRGLPRPSRFNGGNPLPPGGDGSDIGAVELQAVQLYIEPTLVAGQRQFTLYWQNTEPSYRLVRLLQTSGAGLLSSSWTMSSLPIMTINGTNRAAITSPTNNAFFRLLLAP